MMKTLLLCCVFPILFLYEVNAQSMVVPDMELFMEKERYREADKILKERIPRFFTTKMVDTLDFYVGYIGKTALSLKGPHAAKQAVFSFIGRAKAAFPYQKEIVAIYFEAAFFFSNIGDNQLAYNLVKDVAKYFEGHTNINNDLNAIQANMGDYALRMGNYSLATSHYRNSLTILKNNPHPSYEKLYFANNSMGIIMWYSSKLDSGIYYWNKAIEALGKMDSIPQNKHYRVAIVQNNIAECYGTLGRTAEAIDMFEKVIQNNTLFISSPEPHPAKENAIINQLQSIDNLAKIYLDLGDVSKAHDLLYYSYSKKMKAFGSKNSEVYKSTIFLGTIYNSQRRYAKAKTYLLSSLNKIRINGDTATAWHAQAFSQLGVAYEGLKKTKLATYCYEEAYRIFEKVYNGAYDDQYLQYTDKLSLYYARNDKPAKAIFLANKGLDYTLKVQGEKSLATFYKLKNLAEVNLILGKHKESLGYSDRGLIVVKDLVKGSKEMIDSVRIEMQKPQLLLLQAKSRYSLLTIKDTASISALLQTLTPALEIIEKQKTILIEQKDINLLMANYKDLLDFIKQLNYNLFKLTDNKKYIDNLVGLHEAAMYTRIRSRMDQQKAIRFADLPATVQKEERKLKADIKNTLQGDAPHNEKIQSYLTAVSKWTSFQKKLQREHPAYYNMRYESTYRSVKQLAEYIPANITVVRYIFSGDSLFALIATHERQTFITLSPPSLIQLETLNNAADQAIVAATAFDLYKKLWEPLNNKIKTKRVLIIPDDILYNLNFEMLTPVKTTSFAHLAKTCLLNKYAISYHYSMLALSPEKTTAKRKGNFVAFTPEFSEEEKRKYQFIARNDSIHFDKNYISLLPLPFTTILAKKIRAEVGGKLFTKTASTPDVFRKQAGNHRIIHIGTHAESNNDYPEYSRLIFSKDLEHLTTENSLYLFDIYNCNLSSDLAVLTACESGKPGYQDGEGMISMAHAFKYAGSESIMTGLWKIDEQSSTMITGWFYKNLQSGMTKDEALQKAKLKYLTQANGRMLAPQYWAGLVIMGDTSPVKLESTGSHYIYWIAGALLLILIIYFTKRLVKAAK